MLKHLYIENIAIIEKLETDFYPGLCVLSGETGAGKSIIIDSINAVTGARMSREMIRTNEKSAVVAALFEDISDEAVRTAEEMGISVTDKTLLLKREIFLSGHNICHINGIPATLQMLRQIGILLIKINGQHDGLHLLDDANHIDYLDSFAKVDGLLCRYADEYDALLTLNRKIKALSLSEKEKEERLAFIDKRLSELVNADLKDGEWEDLNDLRIKLRTEEKLVASASRALSFIDGDDEKAGACADLMNAYKTLAAAKVPSCERIAETANNIFISASELAAQISELIAETGYSQELSDKTDERISLLNNLASKCSCRPEELISVRDSLWEEKEALMRSDENIEQLKEDYLKKRTVLTKLAADLHEKRTDAAAALSSQMEEKMAFLNMPNARFYVDIRSLSSEKQTKFTKKGTDTVQFLLSANKGEDLKPLSKVASGGELSRIMLSFKNVLSEEDKKITAVFDEVDSGVSGKAASRVARMLSSIAKKSQVLCVTHLPQIACAADDQYRISKQTVSGRTVTLLEHLDEKGRIKDIARLIGGENVTESTEKSAEQLLAESKKIHS